MGKELLNSDKELLLKDLCARLPYNVRMYEINPIHNIQLELFLASVTCESNIAVKTKNKGIMCGAIEEFKPYLFPLSSMTGRLKAELFNLRIDIEDPFQDTLCEIDFYHRNHFDYRGLIEKGLAIDATGLNIY